MRRAARIDANQQEIIVAFRHLGCSVLPLHAVGKGCPDLLVTIAGDSVLVEIKDGSKPPSEQMLTPMQVAFHATWHGPIFIVTDLDDVENLVRQGRI